MRPLHAVLLELVDAVPTAAVDPDSGESLGVTAIDLELPMEWRIGGGAGLDASLPRGRLATGFDPPLGRLRLALERREP
jgi:hypothetical protein